ncbi:MAG TPA: Flp pilus assembly protein CpaB [Phenylobacterium sp.]|jgi:pilus assembly protein CpaB|nr:Flp pilus assembly protein CpaB [Phenylobacterium sp.]
MSLRSIASLAVALFLGLIAVVLVRSYLQLSSGGHSATSSPVNVTPVVVASIPIDRGVVLKASMLKVVSYPNGAVPQGAFKTVAEVAGGANERTSLRPVAANEPVMAEKLSGSGGKATLSVTLTPGMRAVSIRSDEVLGVAGFALPGDRVDILLTRTIGNGAAATTITQVLAENAQVVGVDQSSDVQADKPVVSKAVTVEVTPDQAQAISLAHAVGTISLSLRQVTDHAALARKATTVAELGGLGPRAAVSHVVRAKADRHSPAPIAPIQVHVTRGMEMTGYPMGGS